MAWTAADVRKLGHAMPGDSPRPHKYNARKKSLDGFLFASTKEAKRYLELKILQQAGVIANLELQPRFLLQEKFTDESGRKHRKMEYVGDFRYRFRLSLNARDTVEDCKGFQTEVFKIKWKLVAKKYPEIRFVLWK